MVLDAFTHDAFLQRIAEVVESYDGWRMIQSGVETRSREFQVATVNDFSTTARTIRSTPDAFVHYKDETRPSFMIEAKRPPLRTPYANVLVEALPLAASMLSGLDVWYILEGHNAGGEYSKAFHVSEADRIVAECTIPQYVRRGGQNWTRENEPDNQGRRLAPDTVDKYRAVLEKAFPTPEGRSWPRVGVAPWAAGGSGDPWATINDRELRELPEWRDALHVRMEGNP